MRHTRQFVLVAVLAAFGLTGLWACASSRAAQPTDPDGEKAPAAEAPGTDTPEASAGESATTDEPAPTEETAAGAHVPVPAGRDCLDCHEQSTPEIAEAWRGSPHGMALVKCFVCHGSTGEDFVAAPEGGTCASCHPAESESMGGAGCFGCHDPHALVAEGENPHLDGGAR